MIIKEMGKEFYYEGNRYYVGQVVCANNESVYEGLVGKITEIRDGEDKDTENETPDVYVAFNMPDSCDVKKYEERFSKLYGEEKTIDEICLDLVIMAPSMLTASEDNTETSYVIVEEWYVNDESGREVYGSFDLEDAKAHLKELKEKEQNTGCVFDWKEAGEKIVEDESEDCYEAYIDGWYSSAHYSLTLHKCKN